MNPTYITRQLYEHFSDENFMKGRITKINPLNPNNTPTAWEKEALLSFDKGSEEKYRIFSNGDSTHIQFIGD